MHNFHDRVSSVKFLLPLDSYNEQFFCRLIKVGQGVTLNFSTVRTSTQNWWLFLWLFLRTDRNEPRYKNEHTCSCSSEKRVGSKAKLTTRLKIETCLITVVLQRWTIKMNLVRICWLQFWRIWAESLLFLFNFKIFKSYTCLL